MTRNEVPQIATRQLRPNRYHPGRPTVRTTFQLAGKLSTNDKNPTEQDVWENAIRSVLGWLKDRSPDTIPQAAWAGESFSIGYDAHRIACVGIHGDGIWTARLTHPDMPHRDSVAVAGRYWTTDIALRRDDSGILFGTRVFCTSQPHCTEEIALTRPRIVRYFGDSFGLSHTRPLDGRVWYLNAEDDLDEFGAFLLDTSRVLPVYLLTEADQRRLPGKVSRYMLDELFLGRMTQGLAHVAVLPRHTSFAWMDRVGKAWSAFGGAVRTYRPGLSLDEDAPTEHPLMLAQNMLFWRHDGTSGEKAFQSFLIDQAYQEGVTRRVDWGNLVFFTNATTRVAEAARQQASEDTDLQKLYDDEISALQSKVEQAEEERDEYLDLAEDAERTRDYYIAENDSLHWQIDVLQARLREKTGEDPDSGIEYPATYDDLSEWTKQNLANRLVLHSRAERAVKDAEFGDLQLVCDSLLALAGPYRNSKLGHEGAGEGFRQRLEELGLRCSGSISRSSAGEFGEAYFVRHPLSNSPKQFLELHVRSKGNSRDPKRCLAVYFFWDGNTRQVVVGSLPGHLPISIS